MSSPQILSDAEVEKLSSKADILSDADVARLSNSNVPVDPMQGQIGGFKSSVQPDRTVTQHPARGMRTTRISAPSYSIEGTDYHITKNPDGTFQAASPTRGTFRGSQADLKDTLPVAEYLHDKEQHYQIHHLASGKVSLTVPGKGTWTGSPDDVLTAYHEDVHGVGGAKKRIGAGRGTPNDYLRLGPALGLPKFAADPDPRGDSTESFELYKDHVNYLLRYPGTEFKKGDIADLNRARKEGAERVLAGNAPDIAYSPGNIVEKVTGVRPSFLEHDPVANVLQPVGEMLDNPASTVIQFAAFDGALKVASIPVKAAGKKIMSLVAEKASQRAIDAGVKEFLSAGGSAEDLGKIKSPAVASSVQKVQRSPEFKIAQNQGDLIKTIQQPDRIPKGWKDRTQGLINALDQEIEAAKGTKQGGTKPGRANAQRLSDMRQLRKQLLQSLEDGKPHPAIAQEMRDNALAQRAQGAPRPGGELETKPTFDIEETPKETPSTPKKRTKPDTNTGAPPGMTWDKATRRFVPREPATPTANPPEHVNPLETSAQQPKPAIAEVPPEVPPTPVVKHPPIEQPDPTATGGINQASHESRGLDVQPGTGTDAPEQLDAAKQRVAANPNAPHEWMAKLKAGQITAEEAPIAQADMRVHAMELEKQTRTALLSGDDAAFEAAKAAETQWKQDMKPLATHASETFRGLQGGTNIDTGDWTSLVSAARDTFKTPPDAATMTAMKTEAQSLVADQVKASETALRQHKQQLDLFDNAAKTNISKSSPRGTPKRITDPAAHFEQRIKDGSLFNRSMPRGKQSGAINLGGGPQFTPDEVRLIWQTAKKHADALRNQPALFDENMSTLDSVANRTAEELGLEPDWVKDVIAKPKTPLRILSDEQWRALRNRRDLIEDAKDWATTRGRPELNAWQKTWDFTKGGLGNVNALMRAEKLGLHGMVWPVTHIGGGGFDPASWAITKANYARALKVFSDPSIRDAVMSRMEAHPEYPDWVKAGLSITEHQIEPGQEAMQRFFGKVGKIGDDQMSFLRSWRFEKANQLWGWAKQKRDAALKGVVDPRQRAAIIDDFRKEIADQVNHESGWAKPEDFASPVSQGLMKAAEPVLFGPRLWPSRFMRVFGDTFDVLNALGPDATPAKKWIATYRMKRFGRLLATYVAGGLGTNYAVLKGLGATDQNNINFLDPTKPDWLMFKDLSGTAHDFTGGLMRVLTLPVRAIDTAMLSPEEAQKRGLARDEVPRMGGVAADFVSPGLTPGFGFGLDVIRGHDYQGRPFPWASDEDKRTAKLKTGKDPETWWEYVAKQGPIPVSHMADGLSQGMQEGGLSKDFASKMAESIVAAVSGERNIPPSTRVDRDALGRVVSSATRNDKVAQEMKSIGFEHAPRQDIEGGETKAQYDARRSSDADAIRNYRDAGDEPPLLEKIIAMPEYKKADKKTRKEIMLAAVRYIETELKAEKDEEPNAAKQAKKDAIQDILDKATGGSDVDPGSD